MLWKAVLSGRLRQSALSIVHEIGVRLRDPERVAEIANTAVSQINAYLEIKGQWEPHNIVFGDAALALFFGQYDRCFPDQDWDQTAHSYLVPAARSVERNPGLCYSIFGGLSGLCFAVNYLSRNGSRYQRLQRILNEVLLKTITREASTFNSFSGGVHFYDYDIISGIAGAGAYLLLGVDLPEVKNVFYAIIERLIFLSAIEGSEKNRLRYFIPLDMQATEMHQERYPHGCIDNGLAHGVPGPLALLALACQNGIQLPGQTDAIQRLAEWIITNRIEDNWGINWSYAVEDSKPRSQRLAQAGWCYGAPGIARALWFAGQAIKSSSFKNLSVDAIRTVRERPIMVRRIPGPNLCHGVAGLLQIVLRFTHDTGTQDLTEWSIELVEQLIGYTPWELRIIRLGSRSIDNSLH